MTVCVFWYFPDHQECKFTEPGTEYCGEVSVTREGEPCDAWPDEAENHYCRNSEPESKPNGPWCFTNTTENTWDYCDIPFCKRM